MSDKTQSNIELALILGIGALAFYAVSKIVNIGKQAADAGAAAVGTAANEVGLTVTGYQSVTDANGNMLGRAYQTELDSQGVPYIAFGGQWYSVDPNSGGVISAYIAYPTGVASTQPLP